MYLARYDATTLYYQYAYFDLMKSCKKYIYIFHEMAFARNEATSCQLLEELKKNASDYINFYFNIYLK